MKLSDGNWTFFYAFALDEPLVRVMRCKEGTTPVDRCAEYCSNTGKVYFPVLAHVTQRDRMGWFESKMEHLHNVHNYTLEDARRILGLSSSM